LISAPDLVDLYAMVARMPALSMPKTVACADIVMRSMIETFAGIRELVKTGRGIDPMLDFAEATHEELHKFALL
jgi:hypothetical protein